MLSKKYNIPGILNCELYFLSDPGLIKGIDKIKIKDTLVAKCKPIKRITHQQALSFSYEYIKIILDELEKENDIFYTSFDIDYNNFNIGPTLGHNGIATSFEVRPSIKLKNITGGGFIDEK